ncbi:MmpS family transport accessory protein [Streptomyces sp. NPDC014735]
MALAGCDAMPWGGSGDKQQSKAMVVEVEVTSDAGAAGRVRAVVDARNDPQRVDQSGVKMPYTQTFQVPLDAPFPLTGTSVEATAASDAAWIACRITLDGKVVAEDRAEGPGAVTVCEKKLRAGPQ